MDLKRREFLGCGLALCASGARAGAAAIAAVADYERSSGGHVGFYARNVVTRQSVAWRGDERFVMCSTFKASLAALILRRVDRGQDNLEDRIHYGPSDVPDWYAPVAKANLPRGFMTVREMCAAAVEVSDNTCANLLLARVGGPPAITAFWRAIGDVTSRLDDPEPYLNRTPLGGVRDTTTPAAMASTLERLALGPVLSAAARRTFTGWLIDSQTGADRLRSGLPTTWKTGDKTGNNGKDAAGDIAIAWPSVGAPIVIAAYTRGGSPTAEQFAAVFQGIGRHVAATLGDDARASRAGR